MKTKLFREILQKHWPSYNSYVYLNDPELLNQFLIYIACENLQGKNIDLIRKFAKAFNSCEEYFEEPYD